MTEFGDRIKKELFRKLVPTIEILQGGIYKVADFDDNPIVKFPTDNLPETHPQSNRTFHRQRYVLVV